MPIGTVKWFNNAKGYGFIVPEGGGEDLFVHYSAIYMDGYKTLKAGQAVEYETHEGDKGFHASEVRASAPPPTAAAAPGRDAGEQLSRRQSAPRQGPGADPHYAGDGVAAAMLSAARED